MTYENIVKIYDFVEYNSIDVTEISSIGGVNSYRFKRNIDENFECIIANLNGNYVDETNSNNLISITTYKNFIYICNSKEIGKNCYSVFIVILHYFFNFII